ncbi:MAG: HDOD domain-containing protein [Planctomycetota bacterium]
MATALVGRQPILRPDGSVFGYELLFRRHGATAACIDDGDRATADVFLQSMIDIGLENLVGEKLAFINLTRNLVLSDQLLCIPAGRVVLEILEDIEPDDDVIAAVSKLVAAGHVIALDDFVYSPRLDPLIELADIVKIEYPAIPTDALEPHIRELRDRGVKTILAEKIETHEDFKRCEALGCDLFQGYYFSKPQIVEGRKLPEATIGVVRLVSELQNPDITLARVEQLLESDPALSFRLLRFVNSAQAGTERRVESLKQATALMGLAKLRSLASMMLLSSLNENKSEELIQTAMVRARMCERLAELAGSDRLDRFFTLGLFSVLDALLDLPMRSVVESLPLSSEINEALTDGSGELGETLLHVLSHERRKQPPSGTFEASQLDEAFRDAIRDLANAS